MARWQESYSVGDLVEYNVPACGWFRGQVIRKTRSGIPIVRVGTTYSPGSVWSSTRKTDIRRVAGPVLCVLDEEITDNSRLDGCGCDECDPGVDAVEDANALAQAIRERDEAQRGRDAERRENESLRDLVRDYLPYEDACDPYTTAEDCIVRAAGELKSTSATIARLRGAYDLAVKAAGAASGGGGHDHFDPTGRSGLGCNACDLQRHARRERDRLLAAARSAAFPYVVGNGLYCDEVARFATFDEALEHYRKLPTPKPGEWRAIGIWNEDECDGATDGNPDGLTDEEREQL